MFIAAQQGHCTSPRAVPLPCCIITRLALACQEAVPHASQKSFCSLDRKDSGKQVIRLTFFWRLEPASRHAASSYSACIGQHWYLDFDFRVMPASCTRPSEQHEALRVDREKVVGMLDSGSISAQTKEFACVLILQVANIY